MKHFLSSAALVLAVWALASAAAHAQAPSSGGPAPAATTVPLDGGASLLLAGGIGYALRRLRQRRQR